ncbi:rhamnogalacturonan lyase family protein [Segatella bryantii]|uniref:rhamnogalacturonan lyase family protein n=1 Tax=Segatella bryantii TaxID=77095 RepID=UPI00088155C0|nr:autotransporter-associated beta strand repeat-containing protein [Segatella bryantii]SDL60847.1 autotransporter-associated beta strand repeat-containing protein [Segatella bryantii]
MIKKTFLAALLAMSATMGVQAQRFMDTLDRGLIAVKSTSGVYVSWRIYGTEYYGVAYNIYRDGIKLNTVPLYVSNFTDETGNESSKYTVSAVVNGVEQEQSKPVPVWQNDYLVIPKAKRISNDGVTDITDYFEPNDATFADVDGDGEMEVIIKEWNDVDHNAGFPADGKDFDRIEVYKLDGTLLWWIDCGPNLTDFQHNETNIALYDWDMDGKAEAIMRAADGTVIHMADGTTQVIGDKTVNWRNDNTINTSAYFVHKGDEYLVYMNGQTGKPYSVSPYPLKRLEANETSLEAAWGDGYGHRSSKNFFGAPYFDGKRPSVFLARGIYTQHKMIALDVNPTTHELTTRWTWNCKDSSSPWYGQGYHNYAVADVDMDGRDEIVFGSMVIDDSGKGLSTTGLGHGDAEHVSDYNPYVPGLEIYACNEDNPANNYRDATTSKIYYRLAGGSDDGRSMAGNFTNDIPGAIGFSGHDTPISCVTNNHVEGISSSGVTLNFRTYWDGDLCDESFNGNATRNGQGVIYKYGQGAIKTFADTYTNNDTKATPCFQGDIFGDWREEIAMRDKDNNLRIETTTIPTQWRNYTLLHDPQYRNAMVWQMNGYNQPPAVSYFLGEMEGITVAPPPATKMGKEVIAAGGTISTAYNSKQVLLDETADAEYTVAEGVSPAIFFDNAPSWVKGHDDNDAIEYITYKHTLKGGAFAGGTCVVKQGDGELTLPNVEQTYTGNTDVWAGTVNFDGTMKNSRVWLNRFTTLNSNGGKFLNGIVADYGATVRPGGKEVKGTIETDSLKLNFGSIIDFDVFADGTSDMITTNVLELEKKDWKVGPAYLVPRFNITFNGEVKAGTYTIAKVGKIQGASWSDVKLTGLAGHKGSLSYENGEIKLTIADLRDATSVEWTGDKDATWQLADKENFKNVSTGDDDVFVSGDQVIFRDGASNATVKIEEPVSPSSVTFANTTLEYTLTGDSIVGTSSITKNGNANVNINNVNTFTGSTNIYGGSITVNSLGQANGVNYGAFGKYTNTIYLNGGTLIPSASFTTDHPFVLNTNGGTIQTGEGVTMTIGSSIKGKGYSLTKEGAGTLVLAPTADYENLIVNGGTVHIQETGDKHGVPTNITLNNSTLNDVDGMYSYSSNSANVVVPEESTSAWYLDSRCDYKGKLTGAGTLNLYARNIRNIITGNWSAFTGTINVNANKTGSYTPVLYFANSNGLKNATLNVACEFSCTNPNSSGSKYNVTIGNLKGGGTLSGAGTWTIGTLNQDITYNGIFSGGKIMKTGDGVWTMSKLQQGVGGQTTVNGGVLNLSNSSSKDLFFGDNDVVASGTGTLAGQAYVRNIYVNNGGTIAPGNYTQELKTGSLKAQSSIFCYEGSTAKFMIRRANSATSSSALQAGSMVSIAGNIVVENYTRSYALRAGDSFTLWTANSYSGTPTSITLPELPENLAWDTSELLQPTGVIKVVEATTGIDNIAVNQTISGSVYTVNGIKVANITTTKANAARDIKKITGADGVYVIRSAQGSFKVTVK